MTIPAVKKFSACSPQSLFYCRLLLYVSLFIFFAPLLLLPFFNHATADDYLYGSLYAQKGFPGYQVTTYQTWAGRYAATFFQSPFLHGKALFTHYYIHSLLLIVLNFASLLWLLFVLNRFILHDAFPRRALVIAALLLLALDTISIPELSSFYFWFSSAIIYNLGTMFIYAEITLLMLLYHTQNKAVRTSCILLLPVLFFITNGFSEVYIVIQLAILVCMFYSGLTKKTSPAFVIISCLAYIAGTALSLCSPGNILRAETISYSGIYTGIIAWIFGMLRVGLTIFKNPLFWLCSALLCLYGNITREKYKGLLFVTRTMEKKKYLALIIILFTSASILIGVTGLKGKILPDRYLNPVCLFTLLLLLISAFLFGISSKIDFPTAILPSATLRPVMYGLFAAGILCNTYTIEAYNSLASAPVYDKIMSERETVLRRAALSKNRTVLLQDYQAALTAFLQKKTWYNNATVRKLVQEKPTLLFIKDDLENNQSVSVLKEFYRADSIVIIK